MAISITNYDTNGHTAVLNLGTQEIKLRHLSDLQISVLRANVPSLENVQDATGEPVIETT